MFVNLIDNRTGKRIPKQTCNHNDFDACRCDCHLKPRAHVIECCMQCPYCKRKIPLDNYRLKMWG